MSFGLNALPREDIMPRFDCFIFIYLIYISVESRVISGECYCALMMSVILTFPYGNVREKKYGKLVPSAKYTQDVCRYRLGASSGTEPRIMYIILYLVCSAFTVS